MWQSWWRHGLWRRVFHMSAAKQPSVHFDWLRQFEEHDTATLLLGYPRILQIRDTAKLTAFGTSLSRRRLRLKLVVQHVPRRSSLNRQRLAHVDIKRKKRFEPSRSIFLDGSDHSLIPSSSVPARGASITVCQCLGWFMFMFVFACANTYLSRAHDCSLGIEQVVFEGFQHEDPCADEKCLHKKGHI